MTVLDAYAVIAYLRAEPAAREVRPLLVAGDANLTAVGVAEVLDHMVRLAGANEEDAALDPPNSDYSTASPWMPISVSPRDG